MDHTDKCIFTVQLLPEDAYQLAQLCKRITFDNCYNLTEAHLTSGERDARAYQMMSGINAVADGLAAQDFSPR